MTEVNAVKKVKDALTIGDVEMYSYFVFLGKEDNPLIKLNHFNEFQYAAFDINKKKVCSVNANQKCIKIKTINMEYEL